MLQSDVSCSCESCPAIFERSFWFRIQNVHFLSVQRRTFWVGWVSIVSVLSQSFNSISLELVRETSEAFYKDVTRDGAEKLLMNKQNGTFVIRPSRKSKLGTLSVVQDFRIYHLNIRTREQDGNVALGKEKDNEKCFASISSLINYYVSNYLILSSNGITTLTLLIPYRE